MGRGGDALQVRRRKRSTDEGPQGRSPSGRELKRTPSFLEKLSYAQPRFDAKKRMRDLHNDLTVLKNIWFKKLAKDSTHAQRLEQFYGPQAHACTQISTLILYLKPVEMMLMCFSMQTMDSGPSSYGVVSHCLQHVPQGWILKTPLMQSGLILEEEQEKT